MFYTTFVPKNQEVQQILITKEVIVVLFHTP